MLPPEIERFGIEVRTAAADAAAERGVTIVGSDHRALVTSLGTYDVVVAFDVLEHVTDPADILKKASEVLAPGGRVIFSTGNADAWTWRFMGSRYWYSWYPEHLSFVSSSWIAAHAGALGFDVERAIQLTRAPGNLDAMGHAREFAKNAAYRVLPLSASAAAKGRRQGGVHLGTPAQGAPPNWLDARDHVLAVLRKN